MKLNRATGSGEPSSPTALVGCLLVLGVISLLLGFGGALVLMGLQTAAGVLSFMTALWMVASLVAGGCVGGVMWALAWLCQNSYRRALTVRRLATAMEQLSFSSLPDASPGAAGAPAGGVSAADGDLQAILDQLRDLNANVLLTDRQRETKRRYFTERRSQKLAEQVATTAAGSPDQAQELLDELVAIVPDHPKIASLSEQIDRCRREVEQRDVSEAAAQAEDLMSGGEFPSAEAVATGLLARHPSALQAIALLAKVRREGQTFSTEQRTRMYREIQKHAQRRRWREALEAARAMLKAYPNSPEADAVTAQMNTLGDNARLEDVRELRDQIANLIERKRYGEAVELARALITEFPETAAATDLRGQMGRLEELAKAEDATP